MDKGGSPSPGTMPIPDGISELQERILLGLWKLKGIGNNPIDEELLRKDLSTEPPTAGWADELESLQNQ